MITSVPAKSISFFCSIKILVVISSRNRATAQRFLYGGSLPGSPLHMVICLYSAFFLFSYLLFLTANPSQRQSKTFILFCFQYIVFHRNGRDSQDRCDIERPCSTNGTEIDPNNGRGGLKTMVTSLHIISYVPFQSTLLQHPTRTLMPLD